MYLILLDAIVLYMCSTNLKGIPLAQLIGIRYAQ